MALTKETVFDNIKTSPNGVLNIREQIIESDNGQEVNRYYHRRTIEVASDVSGEVQEIQDAANETWTPEVIAARQAELAPPVLTPEEIEAQRVQAIRNERDKRARNLVSATGRTPDMIQGLAQVLERKHRKGQTIPARLAAMEAALEASGDLLVSIDDVAESAIETAGMTVDQIMWP